MNPVQANLVAEKLDDIKERLVVIETKMENYREVQATATFAKNIAENNATRIEKLEEASTWLWRTVGGSAIVALLGLLIQIVRVWGIQ